MSNWGTVETWSEDKSETIALDVVPVLEFNGEVFMSAAHEKGELCQCKPLGMKNDQGIQMWIHNDPEHPGSNERIATGDYEGVHHGRIQ